LPDKLIIPYMSMFYGAILVDYEDPDEDEPGSSRN